MRYLIEITKSAGIALLVLGGTALVVTALAGPFFAALFFDAVLVGFSLVCFG